MSQQALKQLLQTSEYTLQDKLAFVWHLPETYYHFKAILAHFDPSEFVILLAWDHLEAMIERAESCGYQWQTLNTVISKKWIYPYLVSNHYILPVKIKQTLQDKTPQYQGYLNELIGKINIRMLYGLGKEDWNYAPWNAIYQYHLCFGPWQAQKLGIFSSQTIQMGYPRYDAYFNQPIETTALRQRFGCTDDKPILLWLPTWQKTAIEAFAEPLSTLTQDYHLLVKPHPLTKTKEPHLYEQLQNQAFTYLIDESIDNDQLFALADIILADYGGPLFGAVYLDKPLVLLNHPDIGPEALNTEHGLSSEAHIRQYIYTIYPHEINDLKQALKSPVFWDKQQAVRAWLRPQYFAPYQGYSGYMAAQALREIMQKHPLELLQGTAETVATAE